MQCFTSKELQNVTSGWENIANENFKRFGAMCVKFSVRFEVGTMERLNNDCN